MSRLDIDFAAKPRRSSPVAGLALLLTGAAALSVVSVEIDDLEQQTLVAEARLQSLTRRGASLAARSAPGAGSGKDAAGAAASEVLTRLRAPWPDLLEQLEGLAELPVVVLDLDAEARGRSLRLAGEAKTMDDMLAFVEKLRQSRRLDEVFLEKHEPRKLGTVEVFAFTVQATWPPARDAAP